MHTIPVRLTAAALTLAATVATAPAQLEVTNFSDRPVLATVVGSGLAPRGLAPDTGTVFNLVGQGDGLVEVKFQTLGSPALDIWGFEAVVTAERDGSAYLDGSPRPAAWFGGGAALTDNLYAVGGDINGNFLDVDPSFNDKRHRSVRFLASADCQFSNNGTTDFSIPHEINQAMGAAVDLNEPFRGAIIAGDLTQDGGIGDFPLYKQSIAGYERHIFDGCGNHDVDNGNDRVRPFVRERKRSTIRTNWAPDPGPHYSWDWHDVHFVQLNIMPSDYPSPEYPDKDPWNALTFLENDLATLVGDSGRPVVLIHHYGFEPFSVGDSPQDEEWWTAQQRLEYWQVIKDYNIVLILTGHKHWGPGVSVDTRARPFFRPFTGAGGPNQIRAFNVAASVGNAYTDIEFNSANQIRILLKDKDSPVGNEPCGNCPDAIFYTHNTPIWLDPTIADGGYGWKDWPYATLALANEAATDTFDDGSALEATIEFRLAPGVYAGPGNRGTLDAHAVLKPDGGDVILGAN